MFKKLACRLFGHVVNIPTRQEGVAHWYGVLDSCKRCQTPIGIVSSYCDCCDGRMKRVLDIWKDKGSAETVLVDFVKCPSVVKIIK